MRKNSQWLAQTRGGPLPPLLLFALLLPPGALPHALNVPGETLPAGVSIECRNPLELIRTDVCVQIPVSELTRALPGFVVDSCVLMERAHILPHQTEDADGDGVIDRLLVMLDFSAGETKVLTLGSPGDGRLETERRKRAQADLAVKTEYRLLDGEYTGGRFAGVRQARVPPDHRAHNAYFKYEGPGWESELIGYRLYLDERNRIDIFGKRKSGLVLRSVGVHDLVSNGQESYQSMLEWGRDMFKVGNSLGIGSYALWLNRHPVPVSVADSITCQILMDGPLVAEVGVSYHGWKTGDGRRDLTARLSISAGSRLTDVRLACSGPAAEFVTGLAKHPDCRVLREPVGMNRSWGYLGYFGAQTLTGDSLGTALFFRRSDLVEITEDSLNHLVVLRPKGKSVSYAFGAAWQEEPDGIRDGRMFQQYCDRVARELSAPIVVRIRNN